MSYQDIAFHIFKPYIDTSISDSKLKEIIFESYNKFSNDEITPLIDIDRQETLSIFVL